MMFLIVGDVDLISDRPKNDSRSHDVRSVKPLVDAGYVQEESRHNSGGLNAADFPPVAKPTNKLFNYYKFRATVAGIEWWAREYVAKEELECPVAIEFLNRRRSEDHWMRWDGKGIGAELKFSGYTGDFYPALKGVSAGYFDFVSLYYYAYDGNGPILTVRLTAAGMAYFDSLPRLELECA